KEFHRFAAFGLLGFDFDLEVDAVRGRIVPAKGWLGLSAKKILIVGGRPGGHAGHQQGDPGITHPFPEETKDKRPSKPIHIVHQTSKWFRPGPRDQVTSGAAAQRGNPYP